MTATGTIKAIYLGNFSSLDSYEADYVSEHAGNLVGVTRDYTQMKLVAVTYYDKDHNGVVADDEGNHYYDNVSYNAGSGTVTNYTDGTLSLNVKLTLADGSTKTVEVVAFQQQNGDLFISDLLNGGTLDNLQISSLQITGVTGSNYSGWYTNQSVDNTTLTAPTPIVVKDGYVEGTNNADLIDVNYTGDPEGDRVDANDAVLPGTSGNMDVILAGDGNDTVKAGDGADKVYAGGGKDSVEGGAGNDTIYGDSDLAGQGGGTTTVRESFEWDKLSDPSGDGTLIDNGDYFTHATQDTGYVNVTFSKIAYSQSPHTTFATNQQKVHSITDDGQPVNAYSSLSSELNADEESATYRWTFDKPVSNLSFRINDIDYSSEVLIKAYDINGNLVPISTSTGSGIKAQNLDGVGGNEWLVSNSGYLSSNPADTDPTYSALVNVSGPIARIEITHSQESSLSNGDAGINITDMYYDVTVDTSLGGGAANDDTIIGGAGDDLVFGEGGNDLIDDAPGANQGQGNDTFDGGAGNDTLWGGVGHDSLIGGDGADFLGGEEDNDTLLGGAGNDTALGGSGNDFIDDGLGADQGSGRDSFSGGDGNDTIWGGLDNDTLLGDAGNDQIGGEEGDDLIKGGAGDDTLTGGIGNDTIYGDELGASGTGLSSVDPVALNFSSVRAGSETTNPNAAVAGSSVIYDNVATLDDGTQVSARMVLVSKSSEHLQVDMANTGDHEILLNANNNSAMQGQTATFRLEFFNTVTGAPVTLEPGIVFADLDANGGSEVITINDANLLNVGVGTGTSLDVAFNPGSVTATGSASGTQDNLDPNELDAQVATVFGSTSQVTFTMTSRAYNSGLNFGTFEGQDFNFLANQDAGNDSILGGDGNDLIYGNAGDDTVSGGAGNDTIYGDDPAGTPNGAGDMKALEWTAFGGNGATVANGASTDVGGVKVTVGFAALDSGATATVSTGTQYREADDAFDNDSALRLYGLGGEGGVDQTSKTTLTFDGTNPIYGDEVADVSFRINDVDVGTSSDPHIDIVTVRAFDADGNEVPVTLTPEGSQTVNGQTVTGTQSHSTGIEPNVQAGSVLVNITGPVARIEVTYANGSTTDQQVTLTDLAFKTTSADGSVAGGDDVLFGNDGADVIFGNGGDDTITGGAGADTLSGNDDRDLFIGGTAGDSVDGGTGGDDFDILDLSNSGPLRIVNETTDADGDSTSGTVEFLDSNGNVTGTMTFEEIEQIILPPNSGPDAVDDSDTTQEEVPVTLDLLANDSDVDGDPLTVISATVPAAQGTLVDNGDGTVTFTPAPNFTGVATITYTVSDGNGGTDTALHTVDVGNVNDAPVAVDDTATATEDTPKTLNVLGNDSDPEDDPLTVTSATVPAAQGTVTVLPTGEVVFTPAPDFTGVATITYTVSDGNGGTDTGTVTVDVTPVNDGPDAVDDSDTTQEEVPVTLDLLANDSDSDGDQLTVISATVPAAQGTLVDNGDGTVTFTPAPNFTGVATITYTVSDGNGGTDTALHTVDVTPGPQPDGIVEGTTGDDFIGTNSPLNPGFTYTGDPNGDLVDSNDELLPGEGPNDDIIFGYGGNDTIDAGDGNDDVSGGEGDDTVYGGAGDDSITGDDGNDELLGEDGDDTLEGGAGDDTLRGGLGDDLIDGGDGNESVRGNEGEDTILGGAGNDTLRGGEDNDTVDGGADDDLLFGGEGDDVVLGGDGDDELRGNEGSDTLEGGLGNDLIISDDPGQANDYETFVGVPVDSDPDNNRDLVSGGDGNDTIQTGDDADTVYGDAGDDVIDSGIDADEVYGGDGNDYIDAGLGSDYVEGGAGNDTIIAGIDAFSDYVGDDPTLPNPLLIDPNTGLPALSDPNPNDGKDTVYGGAGNDVIETGDDADVIFGEADNDTINAGIDDDYVDGGTGNDSIIGGHGSDTIFGQDGDDWINAGDSSLLWGQSPDATDPVPQNGLDYVDGGAGNDTIFGEDDDDTLLGGIGNDVIDGGIDEDLIDGGDGRDSLIGGEGDDTILGGQGQDTILGGAGDDIIDGGYNADTIDGGDGNDSIIGGNGADEIHGGAGDDTILGDTGEDTLFGDAGDDSIVGSTGDDTIDGGTGNDTITGGLGADLLTGGDDRDVFLGGTDGDTIDGSAGGDDYDILDLTGSAGNGSLKVTITGPDTNGNGVDGFVTYFDTNGNVTGSFQFAEIEEIIPCFTPGTLIATPKGERLVEELKVGDKVITRDNGLQEIRWIGAKDLNGVDFARNPHLKPILIKAGSLGNGLPERDTLYSPNHRLLINNEKTALFFDEREVLVAAKHLVGAPGVHDVDVMGTTYIHFMFDHHEVVLSNGSWTESFQPGDMSLKVWVTHSAAKFWSSSRNFAPRKASRTTSPHVAP